MWALSQAVSHLVLLHMTWNPGLLIGSPEWTSSGARAAPGMTQTTSLGLLGMCEWHVLAVLNPALCSRTSMSSVSLPMVFPFISDTGLTLAD
jgi:hypothetical protein